MGAITKSLDEKLRRLQQDNRCNEFILADAKDADMAFGLAAPGSCSQTGRPRALPEFREQIRRIVEQELIDIALMSASTCETLAFDEELFEQSTVTPAVRANDSTDIWLATGTGSYPQQPSLPFRSANLDSMLRPQQPGDAPRVDLGLYSVTLNNNATLDRATLEAYSIFRREAQVKGFRHFLEIFPPNASGENAPNDVERFIADSVARLLAGLTRAERPLFLKIPYLGAEQTERLAAYDPSIIIGIMGGAAGTTLESFTLLADAKKHGVRAALFGRRINEAEDQLAFIQHLRWIADGEIEPADAVRSYHAELERQDLRPRRPLSEELQRG